MEAGQTGMGVATFQVASAVSNYQDHLKGRYHNWLESSEIEQYIILDFVTSVPHKPRGKLLHPPLLLLNSTC